MAISFKCSNPLCGKGVRAADSAAGRKAICPFCRTVQIVPAPGEQALEQPLSGGASKPVPQPIAGETISCGDCGEEFPSSASICPRCGWVNTFLYGPPPFPQPAEPHKRAGIGRFATGCLGAVKYGLSNRASIFKLAVYGTVLAFLLGGAVRFLESFLLWTVPGRLVLAVAAMAVQVLVGGFFLRFLLDGAIGSLEGVDEAPDVPPFELKLLYGTGLRGVAVLIVYLLPVVTIPLLPLAWLALAYSDDERAFNVFWALKAAVKRPGALLVLWLFLLLWAAVMVAAVAGVALAAAAMVEAAETTGCFGILISLAVLLLAGIVAITVCCIFATVQFRCIGLLGRHYPELTGSLPAQNDRAKGGAFILAGVMAATAVFYYLLIPALTAIAPERPEISESEPRVSQPSDEPSAPDGRKVVGTPVSRDAPAPLQYLQIAVNAKAQAQMVASRQNLANIGLAMQVYSQSHRRLPDSLDDLVKARLVDERSLIAAVPGADRFTYIAGQRPDMPADNILVYDATVIYVDKCLALRLGGAVDVFLPAELDKAVKETHEKLAAQK